MNQGTETLLDDLIDQHLPRWIALRHDLHAHPELRYEEVRTSDVIADELRDIGFEVTRGLGGTGVVASLPGIDSSRAILLRADMDALPIRETSQHAYASRHEGRMHACGHDGHTVMLLAAARVLRQLPRLPGSVHFVFQPAEEGGAGAKRMLDEGLLERFPSEAVFAMHNWPSLPAGHFGLRAGPIMAAGVRFRITVKGVGAHAAQPHRGIDPVPVACALVLQFQTLCARHKDPVDPAVLSVCMIHAGETDNVVPESVEMRGTIRTLSSRLLNDIKEGVDRRCQGAAHSYGVRIETEFFQYYPATVNTKNETDFCAAVLRATFGDEHVHADVAPNMTSEDFGFMLEARPGAYVLAGSGGDAGLHNPAYDFNDALIPAGVRYWTALAHAWFRRPAATR
ncbi:amidohydrolase [Caballeronia calidae]|uniref:Amidohydrolase n=1 Tax=Caballeronia calidae TaxID=1777139 RepID=A0A158CLW4_9BURK|nr:M20 aminoacylase family protein [Caballeronia calidae]SAK83259.1 amidohydrolase [Caballeronia calidae]